MESSSKTIKANLRGPSKRNKSKKYSPTRDDSKVTLPLKEKRREALQRSVSRRNKSKQSLKNKEGGKHGSLQRQPSGRKNTSNGGYYEQNHIKEPKARSNLKKKGSSLKKYEQEKQALLIMEQMLSQVKEFTNKERSKDEGYKRSC